MVVIGAYTRAPTHWIGGSGWPARACPSRTAATKTANQAGEPSRVRPATGKIRPHHRVAARSFCQQLRTHPSQAPTPSTQHTASKSHCHSTGGTTSTAIQIATPATTMPNNATRPNWANFTRSGARITSASRLIGNRSNISITHGSVASRIPPQQPGPVSRRGGGYRLRQATPANTSGSSPAREAAALWPRVPPARLRRGFSPPVPEPIARGAGRFW